MSTDVNSFLVRIHLNHHSLTSFLIKYLILDMGTVDFGASNNPFVIGRKYDWDAINENPFNRS